jgi:hypothetical protein
LRRTLGGVTTFLGAGGFIVGAGGFLVVLGFGWSSVSKESDMARPLLALIIFTSALELIEARSTLFELVFLYSLLDSASSETIREEEPRRSFSDSDELESESEPEPEDDEEDEFEEEEDEDEDALWLLLLRRRWFVSDARLDLIARSSTPFFLRAYGTTGRFRTFLLAMAGRPSTLAASLPAS